MQEQEIKDLPYKERMGHIGGLWKSVSDSEKERLTQKVKELNEANETGVVENETAE